MRLYKVGQSGYYSSVATNQDYTIADIAAGDFYPLNEEEEIALASYYNYAVRFYIPGAAIHFKIYDDILGVRVATICGGHLAAGPSLGAYDKANFTSNDYGCHD